jgi:hypothetical protein
MSQHVYSFKEYAELRKLELAKKYNYSNDFISKELLIKGLSIAIPMFIVSMQMCYAAPSTGMGALDKGGWKLVKVFQSAIFWMSMIYSLKSLLEVLAKGEGSMKKVMTGATACAGAYLIPWLFTVIRDSFA